MAIVRRDIRVLGPDARPRRKLPRWSLYGLGPVVVLSAIAHATSQLALHTAVGLALVVALVSACALAAWVEERLFQWFGHAPVSLRILAWGALPAVAPFAAVVAGVLVDRSLRWAGANSWAVPVAGIAGLWFAGSALGSLVILVIDALVSALMQSFRARIMVAILCLLAAAFLTSLLATVGIVALDEAARSAELVGYITVNGADRADIAAFVEKMKQHPMLVAFAVYGLTAVISLPAVVSASAKLAEAVMDRIHPLTAALDAIARGERDLHLEEGGSRDFVQMSHRFNQMVDALALGERMERAFGTYVSGRLLDRIRAQYGEAHIPAQLRDASVFFADIRGFTSMSEKLSPTQMVALLNRYFERVVTLVDEHEGYLNKFIGDAVVVVWNGPVEQPAHAEKATRCAIALQRLVAEMNESGAFPEVGALNIGVGVSSGPMVCGNIGSSRQMEYTVIGDTVNLAARLTSHAAPGEVLVSERTADALPSDLPRTRLEPIKVKGKDAPVTPSRVWPAP